MADAMNGIHRLAALALISFGSTTFTHAEEPAKPPLGQSQVTKSGKTIVLVYFEENFKGRPVHLEVPCELNNAARLKEKGIKNDSIMSMKIPDGVVVTLYNADGFGGASKEFTGKAATLGELKGQASSLKAEIKKP
jgi:hypothetical protein